MSEASRRSIRPSGKIEEDQEGEEKADSQPRTRAAESREGRTSRSQDATEVENLDQALAATRSSNRPSVKEEEDQEGEAEGEIQPRARAVDGQEGRKGRSLDAHEAKSPVDPLTKVREKRVLFFNKTDEAKRVVEEDWQRQIYHGYSKIGDNLQSIVISHI